MIRLNSLSDFNKLNLKPSDDQRIVIVDNQRYKILACHDIGLPTRYSLVKA